MPFGCWRDFELSNESVESTADAATITRLAATVLSSPVMVAKDRATKQVSAKVVKSIDKETLKGFAKDHAATDATVCTEDAGACETLPFDHASVKHSLREFVKGDVHANGIETVWSMLKLARTETFHEISPKRLDPHVQKFAGRHNVRGKDTIDQLASIASAMNSIRLTRKNVIRAKGPARGAQAD